VDEFYLLYETIYKMLEFMVCLFCFCFVYIYIYIYEFFKQS